MKLDGNKKLFECTLDEVKQYLQVSKEEDEILTTEELAEVLNCTKQTIIKYHKWGMGRVKKNAWKKNLCIWWVENELPKILQQRKD